MENQLKASIELINEGVKFRAVSTGKPEIITDYIPPYGDGNSILPLELFLMSLGTCIGSALSPIIKKMQKNVSGLALILTGDRRSEHPTGFSKITITIKLKSSDATVEDLQKAITYAEGICPVWSMVDKRIAINLILDVSN